MNTEDKLIRSQALYFPLLKMTSSTAVFNRVKTLVWWWAICCSDCVYCLNIPSPLGDPLTFFLSSYQGDTGCPRQKVGLGFFFHRSSQEETGQKDMQAAKLPRNLGATASYKRVNFFAGAWRQLCFAELALAEILLKGIQTPLCLWTSKLLPKYHSKHLQAS